MNRQARRQIMKQYRHNGMSKQQAKEVVNANFLGDKFKEGSKCRLNYELIIRVPEFNLQQEEFKQWIVDHKDDILTVDKIRYGGTQVTFKEDTNSEQFWHMSNTLIPVAFATVKLDDGLEKSITLGNVKGINDPQIMQTINEELNKEEQ